MTIFGIIVITAAISGSIGIVLGMFFASFLSAARIAGDLPESYGTVEFDQAPREPMSEWDHAVAGAKLGDAESIEKLKNKRLAERMLDHHLKPPAPWPKATGKRADLKPVVSREEQSLLDTLEPIGAKEASVETHSPMFFKNQIDE